MAFAGTKSLKLALFKPEINQGVQSFSTAQLPNTEDKKFIEEVEVDLETKKKPRAKASGSKGGIQRKALKALIKKMPNT